MRINQPVTSVERHIPDGEFVLSRTDLKGVITYVNRTFVEISGYTEAELIGQPHNLVRHPDMPKEGFQDLWNNLKAGKLWTGFVKNRAKNGDYYWVLANVTPIREDGQVTGYLSIRTKPDHATIEQVEGIYRKFREGKARGLAIRDGKVVKTNRLSRILNWFDNRSIKARVSALLGIFFIVMLGMVASAFVSLKQFDAQARRERQALGKTWEAADLARQAQVSFKKQVQEWKDILLRGKDPGNYQKYLNQFEQDAANVDGQLRRLKPLFAQSQLATAPVDAALASHVELMRRYQEALKSYSTGASAVDKLVKGIDRLPTDQFDGLVAQAKARSRVILERADKADEQTFHIITAITLPIVLACVALLAWLGITMLRAVVRPLKAATDIFERIGQGRYDNIIMPERDDEIGALINSLKDMQIRLGCDMLQTRRTAGEMARVNLALKEVGSAVTVADQDTNVIFVNDAAEKQIGQITGKDASLAALKGTPAFQLISNSEMLGKLNQPDQIRTSAEGEVNGRFLRINCAQVFDEDNHLVGYVTQWLDRTEEVEAERRAEEAFRMSFALKNVETAVTVTDEGDKLAFVNSVGERLMQKITGDAGAVAGLMGNELSGIVGDERLKSLLTKPLPGPETAEGTLNGHIIRLYSAPITDAQGRYIGRLSQWLDRTAEVAAEREISQLVESVACGDFSRRMDESDKEGFFRVIAQGLNQLSEVSERGLNEVAGVLNALANGDLTQRMESDYEGMFGQIKDDANRTVDQLRDIVGAITEATDAIHGAAREIVAGNTDLGQRTESQSASLEQTAASTEELNSTVKNNDDNARQANELAKNATEVAARGGQVVQQVVETMGAITESSTKIAEIISVIDGIAFQTNILALNAAVEAARAGEQGRGFAVVAGEVRNLAQRSAAAAKEIKQLISESVTKVTTGHRLVEAAGATMSEVVESIGRVSHIMNEITVSSAEQRNGIEQLNLAITNMDEATQQNVALVEEASAAAQAMEDQTQNLKQAVSTFRMEGPAAEDWDGRTERRSPNRPANVERLPGTRPGTPTRSGKPKTAIGGEDTWEEF